ncbi:hypothetical protein AAC03nite_03810 [Alicyclobacillus acidoterrestris]|uniref:hypothetical protein n=1 Tax=Alicyclobacillus suci TaxID=2816080 RepID=UPI001191FA69|nr:hypothetical protein [Alicyclobacillus suci]GEO24596.1 hypothetical protein AAC03nite_03810 [Alicyclobacillus acidoterrestris]
MGNHASLLIFALLILFIFYRRIRRNIGFQVLRTRQMMTRSIIFMVIGVLLLAATIVHPICYISDAIGICIGLVLAFFAIRTTQFQYQNERWTYRPNVWVGSIVIVMFLARIVYAFYYAYHTAAVHPGAGSPVAQNPYIGDPWTSGIIFILFAYYPCYFLFLVRKEKHLELGSA